MNTQHHRENGQEGILTSEISAWDFPACDFVKDACGNQRLPAPSYLSLLMRSSYY